MLNQREIDTFILFDICFSQHFMKQNKKKTNKMQAEGRVGPKTQNSFGHWSEIWQRKKVNKPSPSMCRNQYRENQTPDPLDILQDN